MTPNNGGWVTGDLIHKISQMYAVQLISAEKACVISGFSKYIVSFNLITFSA